MLIDLVAVNVTFFISFFLRFDTNIPARWLEMYAFSFWAYSLISLGVFSYCQFYEHDWRYITARNMIRFAGGVLVSVLAYILVLYFARNGTFPRGVILMQIILATAFVSGIRLSIHLFYFWQNKSFAHKTKKVLIVGAGDAGESLVRDILRKQEIPYDFIGFLDDDKNKIGMLPKQACRVCPALRNLAVVKAL